MFLFLLNYKNKPSLPLRERGLKFHSNCNNGYLLSSLPLRERGLKYVYIDYTHIQHSRSPCGSVD